jgi:nucleoside-diphosphate-sugar epimerase
MNKNKIVVGVTGGNGFLGRKIVEFLDSSGIEVVSLQRSQKKISKVQTRLFDLSNFSSISKELTSNLDIIIHTAALVHNTDADYKSHQKLNFEATKRLYKISQNSGVKKFIFLSTVGVYGLSSFKEILDVSSSVSPKTPYATAKLDTEKFLLSQKNQNTRISIIRLPLVYGENAPGNYGALEKLSKINIPLPFGGIKNKRSMISVDNVAKVLFDACKNLEKHNGLHLLAEPIPISTTILLSNLRQRNISTIRLFPVPKFIFKFLLVLVGKRKMYEQLFENLIFKSSIDIK